MVLHDPKGRRFGMLRLAGDEKEPAVVKLGPPGTVKGRLVGEDGKPLAGVAVRLDHRDREAWWMHEHVHQSRLVETGSDGRFRIDDVIAGMPFALAFSRGTRSFAPVEKRDRTAPAGKALELGDVKVKPEGARRVE
jgi:hypothetical protein